MSFPYSGAFEVVQFVANNDLKGPHAEETLRLMSEAGAIVENGSFVDITGDDGGGWIDRDAKNRQGQEATSVTSGITFRHTGILAESPHTALVVARCHGVRPGSLTRTADDWLGLKGRAKPSLSGLSAEKTSAYYWSRALFRSAASFSGVSSKSPHFTSIELA